MRQLTAQTLLDQFDEEVHDKIREAIKSTQATHIVLFENLDMSSSSLGKRTALCVGPSCTFKSPEDCEGKHLNDLPSQRQYPTGYADAKEVHDLIKQTAYRRAYGGS